MQIYRQAELIKQMHTDCCHDYYNVHKPGGRQEFQIGFRALDLEGVRAFGFNIILKIHKANVKNNQK